MDYTHLFKKTVPILTVTAYFIKLMFYPATLSDAFVLLILSSLVAFLEWKLDRSEMTKHNAYLKQLEQKIEDLDKKVATVKLASNFSNINGVRKP